MRYLHPSLCTLACVFIACAAWSQSAISGKVTDRKTNAPLANVSVYIPDLKLGAATNSSGAYTLKNVPRGSYLLVASMTGYASQTKEITIKQTATTDFALDQSVSELSEVIVTGVSSATEQKSNPIPINVITNTDLLQNSGSNLIDALSISPGVFQMTQGASISKPFIRGLGYNRVVTVNDGIRQEGQQWFDEFGEEIDEYTVSKAEILKGPASLSYGSDAMAGVINLLDAPSLPQGQIKGSILANYQTNNGLIAAVI